MSISLFKRDKTRSLISIIVLFTISICGPTYAWSWLIELLKYYLTFLFCSIQTPHFIAWLIENNELMDKTKTFFGFYHQPGIKFHGFTRRYYRNTFVLNSEIIRCFNLFAFYINRCEIVITQRQFSLKFRLRLNIVTKLFSVIANNRFRLTKQNYLIFVI